MAQPLELCTSSYCPVHTWSVAQRHARQQWFESQLGGTQPIVPVHAFPLRHWTSSACSLHQGRSATWADSQVHIPRAVCYNQSLKKEFLVAFLRSTYFYFEAHNLLRHPKFSSTNLKKKKWKLTQLLPRSQVVRWSGWPLACCMCSLNLTSSEKQSSRPAIKPFQFLSDEFEISNPEIQPPPFPLWEVGAGMGRELERSFCYPLCQCSMAVSIVQGTQPKYGLCINHHCRWAGTKLNQAIKVSRPVVAEIPSPSPPFASNMNRVDSTLF